MAEQTDEREQWRQNCLAKARLVSQPPTPFRSLSSPDRWFAFGIYCEFAAGVAADDAWGDMLKKLAAEWEEAAQDPPKDLIAEQGE